MFLFFIGPQNSPYRNYSNVEQNIGDVLMNFFVRALWYNGVSLCYSGVGYTCKISTLTFGSVRLERCNL